MTLIALRTGVAHLLSGRTPQIHALSSPYAASTRSLGAAALSPRSSPPQTFNHLLRSRILPRLVQAASGAATVQIPVTELQQTSLGSALWQQFAAAVTGEWEGITVTFTPGESGVAEPQELPSRYVPAAFAEWDVKVLDWHTQHSTLAGTDGLSSKLKRLMPIVGCEADAVAFEEVESHTLRALPAAVGEAKTILADGSYSIGPRQLAESAATARVEHCLVRDSEHRARVVFNLKRLGADNAWRVLTTEVHFEQREGPYNGGTDLAACGYLMEKFGEEAPVEASKLAGPWHTESGARFTLASNGGLAEAPVSDARVSTEASEGVQRYPGNVWTAARIAGEAIVLEAGWLLDETVRKVAVRGFGTDGLMTHTSFATELRGSAPVVAGSRGGMSAAAAGGGGGNGASTMGSGKGSDGVEQTAPGRQNVLGGELQPCCTEPGKVTGYFRDGLCRTVDQDRGTHVICAVVTDEFLDYTKALGNDLSTPHPPHFAGLVDGSRWCLCATRWREALRAGKAPPVVLESTAVQALQYVTLEQLQEKEYRS